MHGRGGEGAGQPDRPGGAHGDAGHLRARAARGGGSHRRAAVLTALLAALLWYAPAFAEAAREDGLSALSALSDAYGGPDLRAFARRLLAGDEIADAARVSAWFTAAVAEMKQAFARQTLRLMTPGAFSGLAGALLGRQGRTASGMRLICRMAGAGLLATAFIESRAQAQGILASAAALANGIAPVLVSTAALTGQVGSTALVTPMAALCTAMLENCLCRDGLTLCGLLAALAAAGNLSDSLRMGRLFAFGRKALIWGMGTMVAAFMGLLSAQGLLIAGRDGFASKAAHLAVENLVPIIGREVSDALESLTLSGGAVRGVIGLTSMALVAGVCARPMLSIAAAALSAKLAGALSDIAGDPGLGRMADAFGEAIALMLAMCLGGALLVLLLAGGATALGGGA